VTRPLILLATFLAGAAGTQAQQPLFRSGTELVRVDVLVTDDGAPVAGLTAADFEVRDKGVRQRVTSAGVVAAVQLGVVLDVSGSMTGERLAIARSATIDLLGRLTRDDKFAIVAFGDQVGRVTAPGATVAEAAEGLDRMRAGGATALLDGTYAGILESDGGPGPKLLLVMTDGRNNASWLSANAVIDAARRHETVIYPVAVDINAWWDYRIVRQSLSTSDAVALLKTMADETGGRSFTARWNSSLGETFQQILREYRQRYILTFMPEGVPTGDGWHPLEVKVKRGGALVRARTRYWAGKG
jgi:VWFA-related protein